MRNILLLLCFISTLSINIQAQSELKRVHIPYNARLAQEAAREQRNLAKAAELNAGSSQKESPQTPGEFLQKSQDPCPLFEPGTYYLSSTTNLGGPAILSVIDTADLDSPAWQILPDCSGGSTGSAELVGDTLVYWPSPFVDGGRDTVCVELCDASGSCDTLVFPLVVSRDGERFPVSPVFLQPEELLPEYCLDILFLPGQAVCSFFTDCPDNYAGEGQQQYWQTGLDCIGYQAARFAGTDTVCLVVCDEYAVCDTFEIPFVIQGDTLGLPFFDDFSYAGPYPDKNYWLDKAAYINDDLAKDPPSVGMATLDGLDAGGRPYPASGKADLLTSNYIDLSAPQGDVYLKFYLAPKGYGLLPNPGDSLLVQFRAADGDWNTVAAYPGIDVPVDSVPPFSFHAIPVTGGQYLYRGFQFRFVSFSSPPGIYDLWHVDYVWLDDQSAADSTFPDLAFTEEPPLLLKRYSAMPLRQFRDFVQEELNIAPMPSHFYNHFDNTATIAESAISLQELQTGIVFPGMENVVDGLDANIPPAEHVLREKELSAGAWSDYQAILADGFDDQEEIEVEVSYEFTLTSQAAPFYRNDTVRSLTTLKDYYAYDDGTAEGYVAFSNPQEDNPMLAVRFHTHLEDSLRAVQFHFPHVNGNAESQLFNLKVWVGELDDEPDYTANFLRPKYADTYYDTLQGFSTYLLQDYITGELTPLYIPADTDFYVAFQQVTITNEGTPIGMDFSRDRTSEFFVKLSSQWDAFPDFLHGALMVRALMDSEEPLNNTATSEASVTGPAFTLYPNPVWQGAPSVRLLSQNAQAAATHYRLTDIAGRTLASGKLSEGQTEYILPLPAHTRKGLYFLVLESPGKRQSLKLLVE